MVVSSPWPGCTTVSSGSVSNRELMESMMVGKSENERPVAPGPPLNSVSPVKTAPSGQDRDDVAVANGLLDRLRVVGGVDDQYLVIVSDQPDVVVHIPGSAVEGERSGGHYFVDARHFSPFAVPPRAADIERSRPSGLHGSPRMENLR